jgi:activator of HSP90 ATPase
MEKVFKAKAKILKKKELKKFNPMNTNTIQQTLTFETTAKHLYEALLHAEQHSAFTEAEAIIDPKVNGKFSVYDGYCHGYTIALIPDEKIVQAWHFKEEGWPDDHYSICTFAFVQQGNKTILHFTQTGVPEKHARALSDGWQNYYWEPLQNYFAQ